MQTIWQLNQLNQKQLSDIETLVQECLAADGLERTLYLSNNLNYYENMDCFYLLYRDEKLVSVLTMLQLMESEAEISAYTLPKERNKGYFSTLLGFAKEELARYKISRILFVTESLSNSGIAAAKACHATYDKSEYLLELPKDKMASLKKSEEGNENFTLKELEPKHLERAATLSSELFGTDVKEDLNILKGMMKSEDMKVYCSILSDELIGIGNVNYGKHSACIYGFGIAVKHQGKGYGRKQLDLLLAEITNSGCKNITLEVGSENKKAFSLYQSAGFQVKTQYDYYELMI